MHVLCTLVLESVCVIVIGAIVAQAVKLHSALRAITSNRSEQKRTHTHSQTHITHGEAVEKKMSALEHKDVQKCCGSLCLL